MKLGELFEQAIQMGIDSDPRGQDGVEKALNLTRKSYQRLSNKEKEFFDLDSLTNPYADSRILCGDEDAEIKKIIVGIDMEAPELLLTDTLNKAGAAIDLVVAHHPKGRALAALDQVMQLQPGAWANVGVARNITEALLEGRAEEVKISTGGGNYNRAVDVAKLLGLKMICLHTPCDNLVNAYLTAMMQDEEPETLSDVLDILVDIPEYSSAAMDNNAPMIVSGNKNRSVGKVFVDMTGGTSCPKEYYRLLGEAGISTVLCMHAGKEAIEEAKSCHLNLVIAGHMASDSLGINLVLDSFADAGIEIVPISGMIRVNRSLLALGEDYDRITCSGRER